MNLILQQLREKIGLDADSVGLATVERAIRFQMKRFGFQTAAAYAQLLASSPANWAELVEAVVVTETWFFREHESFAALVRFVQEDWLPAHPLRQLRLLCLPCASGEEPYSAAMALLDAGVPPARFCIDAADISARALAHARSAIYGKNSFRGQNLGFRQRYFCPLRDRFVLTPAIRNCVQFEQGNLLDESFARGKRAYDVVFCRNLLIYFDRLTQATALTRLAALLSADGLLFVSPAEQPITLANGFVSADLAQGFACRKPRSVAVAADWPRPAAWPANPGQALLPAESPRSRWPAGDAPLPQERVSPRGTAPPERGSPAPQGLSAMRDALRDAPVSGFADLECARRLADAGRLADAAALCEQHLSLSPSSAQAYYLLGLVLEAGGDPRAAECYRKALYLEPRHYQSLRQLASLAEKDGDPARAGVFKRRAQRLKAAE